MKLSVVADLCGAVADLIAENPTAAAFTARKLSGLLHQQAAREEEQEREREERNARAGYGRDRF